MTALEYRDDYEGRGKYAKENHSMLDQEQLRLGAWQDESTKYRPAIAPAMIVAALLFAAVAAAVAYFFALRN